MDIFDFRDALTRDYAEGHSFIPVAILRPTVDGALHSQVLQPQPITAVPRDLPGGYHSELVPQGVLRIAADARSTAAIPREQRARA